MRVLVLGRAKTGTTLVAKVIQASLPKHRLWFEPRSLKYFVGDLRNAVTKVIHDHWMGRPHSLLALLENELEYTFEKRIAILRDPRDELISRMYYMIRGAVMDRNIPQANIDRWIEIIREKEAHPQRISVKQLLEQMNELLAANMQFNSGETLAYFDFVKANFSQHHVMRYEDFIAGERQALIDYLGAPLVDNVAEDDLIRRTRRSSSAGNWKSMFLESDLAEYMAQHGEALAANGYADAELVSAARLDPAHGSDYVARMAATAYDDRCQIEAWLAKTGKVA